MPKTVAVVLAGCGVYDGSEINEVVLTLLALEESYLKYQCFAPDMEQAHVIDHFNGGDNGEKRNVLHESARIVRGNVKPLDELGTEEYCALIVTGGFGVAKNLSSFAFDGREFEVLPLLAEKMKAFSEAGKPSGYLCIAPVMLPKVFDGIECTIGTDSETAGVIEALGGRHIPCQVNEIAFDSKYKVVSTPAYMLAENLMEAKSGIDALVAEVTSLV
ncbi:isoprenoid biosynthesis glyoxalase ElbB [Vibrio sp. JC009]|uniref:isoprenoid biosynthesis glyoxalase ElbB n=1 Tax=Vibrio sp. JC009 TaxID=2912314 RepID=UPI0023B17693|nr:isoprenoid biosynthesis glyoxalase ElbB [Vibrio sp. JC009]WED20846.1 isoprenoid biosynthesis glyoxalase ElbB [Vibrio sp. JC009]